MTELQRLLNDPATISQVDGAWDEVTKSFELADSRKPERFMERAELSFHTFVKLLGFLCIGLRDTPGDIVEIGVWKGKSLAFMRRLADPGSKVIGIDPCALPGQDRELNYFKGEAFPDCPLIQRYSQEAVEDTLEFSRAFKLLHIDGGHWRGNVWADFLLYERFVVSGGYVVFDDYADHEYSPEVGPAVDRLREAGFFAGYDIIGQPPGYELSYVLRKADVPQATSSAPARFLDRIMGRRP